MKLSKVTAAATIVAAVMTIMLLSACAGSELLLKNSDTGTVWAEYSVDEGDTFAVTFVHSVNKSPVTETYEIKDGSIYLTSCIYYGFGAGVATEMEDGWVLSYGDNGEMIISGIDKRIDCLNYIVGTVSDHILEIDGQSVSLRDLCGQNSKVSFQVQRK
ncbi:MAG: DUF1850 domain-containing protein [Oscillospiraceae bacterium]|nr:DUF1850 domain-containing protein [Oscillospiraceae bacterium]